MKLQTAEHTRLFSKFLILSVCLIILLNNSVYSQNYSTDKITYEGQDLRFLAKKYLENADLWEIILQYNGLNSPVDLQPGMELTIPSGLIKKTISTIEETNRTIDLSTENGAKVFTPGLLNEATNRYNEALKMKDKGEWNDANRIASEALSLAKQSLEQSQLLRNQSADATLSFIKGDVQKRKPSRRLWNEADLFEKLYEEDRTRTLSESFAEITFIDLSRVRLNENSQALIQRSRVDMLSNKTETKIRLVKGDAFAYLLKSPKKKFDIDVPGLDAKIRSKNFWIEKQNNTKIANYEGEIELEAKGTRVVVKENQGSIIPDGGAPSEPRDLLPAPNLTEPVNSAQIYSNDVQFKWTIIDEADQYWFELASDPLFKELVYSNKSIRDTVCSISSLNPGIYYWHVSSIDKMGFPGNFVNYNYLNLIVDENKPFLHIATPDKYTITKEKRIQVAGETETSAQLLINDKNISIKNDGTFLEIVELNNGYNKISINSIDKAGNNTLFISEVIYEADSLINFELNSKDFDNSNNSIITNSLPVIINGVTRPLSDIDIRSSKGELLQRTYADTTGRFMYKLNSLMDGNTFIQSISTPAGYIRNDNIKIILDNSPPDILIDNAPPQYWAERTFTITGKVIGTDQLFINDKPISLLNDSFTYIINLEEGINNIALFAKDLAGNTSGKTFHIELDIDPPVLISQKIIRSMTDASIVRVELAASDVSGMKKTARCIVKIDEQESSKFLILNETSGKYELQFVLNNPGSTVKLVSVTLMDYLNNQLQYKIN